jgi:predicted PurR-regulated permease PerM
MTPLAAKRALFCLLIAALILVGIVLRPLARALFLAVVLASFLFPAQKRLTIWLRGRYNVAAGGLVLAVILIVLGPLVALSAFMVKEGIQAVNYVSRTIRSEGVMSLVDKLPGPLESGARRILEQIPVDGGLEDVANALQGGPGNAAAAAVGGALAATGSLVFQSVMMLIALFFLLTTKDELLAWIDESSPLRRGQTRELIAELRKVSGAVLTSSFATAAVQSVAAVIGYAIARVPYPFFFCAVTFVFAFIPAIGAASVGLMAAALLFLTGHTAAAIFLAIWSMAVVGLVDNVIKPWLVKRGVELHGAVVFFSLLGGLAAFGTIGLLIGPLAVSLFVAVLRIYRRDYGETTGTGMLVPTSPTVP